MIRLYNYFRSSASYRVRLALNFKDIKFEYIPIHLLKNGGEQNQAEYRRLNPMAHVPTLELDDCTVFESMAILQYLDDVYPAQRLFPTFPQDKAKVLQICELVNSGIQPLQNSKLIKYLEDKKGFSREESSDFVRHWIKDGMGKLEEFLCSTAGQFSFGDHFTAADCFVVPQIATAQRFQVDTSVWPSLTRIYKNALALDFIKKSAPDQQPDSHT